VLVGKQAFNNSSNFARKTMRIPRHGGSSQRCQIVSSALHRFSNPREHGRHEIDSTWIHPAAIVSGSLLIGAPALSGLQNSPAANASTATQGDGSHGFDFLIGDWKAHVRRLPERLKGSSVWVEYDGISNHKKLLDSNANF
jgi:hypothetical protein